MLDVKIALKEQKEEEFEELKKTIEPQNKVIESLRDKEKADSGEYISKKKQYDDLNHLLKESKEKIMSVKEKLVDELKTIKDSVQKIKIAYEEAKAEYDADKGALDAASTNIKSGKIQLKREQELLDKVLTKYKFDDFTEYTNAYLEEEFYRRIKADEGKFSKEKFENETRLSDLKKEEIETKKRIDVRELEDKIQELKIENEVKEDRKANISARFTINSEVFQKLKTFGKDFEKADAKYAQSKKLNNIANGSYKFETYIQGVFFDQILQQANVRLSYMMNNQFELKRGARSSGNRGLDLLIHDYRTGKDRDVRSLSGGESFVTSLSMALGLSDVVQYNNSGIKLDTMFIDEGFGSLDSDTLEQSISILNEMSKGDCLVGIISHVNELRERIDKKIIVTKSNNGSKLEIVC